jgi:hypothetical protein
MRMSHSSGSSLMKLSRQRSDMAGQRPGSLDRPSSQVALGTRCLSDTFVPAGLWVAAVIRGPSAEALGYCRGISWCEIRDAGFQMRSTAVSAVWRVGVSPVHPEKTRNNRRDACWPHSQDGRVPINAAAVRRDGRLLGTEAILQILLILSKFLPGLRTRVSSPGS